MATMSAVAPRRCLVVDGVFFQLANSGIARVWRSILPLMAQSEHFRIFLLDRGGAPIVENIMNIPFARIQSRDNAADSLLIQKVCDDLGADAFVSTYYTSPVHTPMLAMIYDMIPELLDFDLTMRDWQEKEITISFARKYLAISASTKRDLLALYPEIPPAVVRVAYCGVDKSVFFRREPARCAEVLSGLGIGDRPFVIFVGSRVQHQGYKNSRLFFDALQARPGGEFDILCVGGEPEIEASVLEGLPEGTRLVRADLSDDDLAHAYSAALGLIYPSLYEGFGLPVIEAMACGCPVVTTVHGSLAEASGDAAIYVSGQSIRDMNAALTRLLTPDRDAEIRQMGQWHADRFEWNDMANAVIEELVALCDDTDAGLHTSFLEMWERTRFLQAKVDC